MELRCETLVDTASSRVLHNSGLGHPGHTTQAHKNMDTTGATEPRVERNASLISLFSSLFDEDFQVETDDRPARYLAHFLSRTFNIKFLGNRIPCKSLALLPSWLEIFDGRNGQYNTMLLANKIMARISQRHTLRHDCPIAEVASSAHQFKGKSQFRGAIKIGASDRHVEKESPKTKKSSMNTSIVFRYVMKICHHNRWNVVAVFDLGFDDFSTLHHWLVTYLSNLFLTHLISSIENVSDYLLEDLMGGKQGSNFDLRDHGAEWSANRNSWLKLAQRLGNTLG
ncbi:hypothetical protein Tco_0324163 [Tanacetum coccineum]